jgi:hypothetical protein
LLSSMNTGPTCHSEQENRVGGGVTSAVLPHHRTYGSVYGGSQSKLEASALFQQ